ncbi:MAG: glycosyltransferase family 39 protein [Pseudomonadota bacterium]|nr:glycosyltransferase family 39 protein [Pseudomonadota bacterium]
MNPETSSTKQASLLSMDLQQRWLLITFVLLKLALIWFVPLTGDEAYFIVWGQDLSLGYYDHPPAVGWLLFALSSLYDNLVFYRMFSFGSAVMIAYLLYRTLMLHPNIDQQVAYWVGLAFFVSPISLMFVVTANDTVLVFFAVVGFYFFAKALAKPNWLTVIWAGLFLGMAFLSKYFAAFMLLGLLAYSTVYWKKHNLKQIALMVAIVLLFVAENLYFNATHCWNNILFNFFSRTQESVFDITHVLSYIVMIGLLLSPLGIHYLIRDRSSPEKQTDSWVLRLALYASLPLLAILLLVSFTNQVGLHWPLISVTILYLLYSRLSQDKLQNLYRFNAFSSLVIGGGLLVALLFVDQLVSPKQQHQVMLYTQPEKVCELIPTDSTFFTLDYSSQSVLSYHCGNDNVHVFKSVSKYGREDDKKTNFKEMDGQSLSIFIAHKKDLEKVASYFKSNKVTDLKVSDEVTYYWLEGQGFDYSSYREKILKPVNEAYYTAPDWFPKLSESCGFKQKYDF